RLPSEEIRVGGLILQQDRRDPDRAAERTAGDQRLVGRDQPLAHRRVVAPGQQDRPALLRRFSHVQSTDRGPAAARRGADQASVNAPLEQITLVTTAQYQRVAALAEMTRQRPYRPGRE